MKKEKAAHSQLVEALRQLLLEGQASTQEQMCRALESGGYEVNQSKISRLLKKINAVKCVSVQGQTVYSLPREPAPPTMHAPMKSLIVDIASNETLVVIFTSPGSASMVARILDYNQISTEILGTIAGDDTIFVAPKSVSKTAALLAEIKDIFKEQFHNP